MFFSGLFTTHIPYILSAVFYLAYLGVCTYTKQKLKLEDLSVRKESMIISSDSGTKGELFYADYIYSVEKEALLNSKTFFSKKKEFFLYCIQDFFIPDKNPLINRLCYEPFLRRPPPSLIS